MSTAAGTETQRRIETLPIHAGQAFGAEIPDIDLRTISDADFAELQQAWTRHQVLLFRDQTLSDRGLIAFSPGLPGLDHGPIQEKVQRFAAGMPEVYVVSNVIENGVA